MHALTHPPLRTLARPTLNLVRTVPDAGTFEEVEGLPFLGCGGSCYTGDFGLWPHLNGVPVSGTGTMTKWKSPQFVDIDNDGDYDLLLCGCTCTPPDELQQPELCRSRESSNRLASFACPPLPFSL